MPTKPLEPRTVKRNLPAKQKARPQPALTNASEKPRAEDCLRFPCPSCAKPIRVKVSAAGKKGRCPSCSETLTFPLAEGENSAESQPKPAEAAAITNPAAVAKALQDRKSSALKVDRPAPKSRTMLPQTRSYKPRPVPKAEGTSQPSPVHARGLPSPALMAITFAAGLALGVAGGRWSVSPGSPFATSPDTNDAVELANRPALTPAVRESIPSKHNEAPATSSQQSPRRVQPSPTESDPPQVPAQAKVPAPEPNAVARAEKLAEPVEAVALDMPEEAAPPAEDLDKAPVELPEEAGAPAVSQAFETAPAHEVETVHKHAPDEEMPEQPEEISDQPEAVVNAVALEKSEPSEKTPATVGVEPAAEPVEPSVEQEPDNTATPKNEETSAEASGGARRFANARDLHEAVDTRYQGDDGQWRTTLVLTNKRGEKRVRELQRFRKEKNHLAKVLLFYLAPSDIKGTSTLTIEQEGEDDLQRMWLPALMKNRRIAGTDKGKSWAGTDFTYEDLRERKAKDYTYGALREEVVDGQPCWCYELKPVAKDKSSYGRIEQWVRKDNLEPIFVKFYDKKDRFFKELRFRRLVQIQGVWASLHWEMINHEDEHKTEFFVTRARYNQGLGEDHFSPRAMTELPGDFEGESFEWGSK